MPKKTLDFFNQYRDLASASKFGVRKRVNNIINLYMERKIYNVKTATSLLSLLTDKTKKNVDLGIKRYNEVLEKFQNTEPLNARRQRVKQEKVERKLKSVLKIQNLLRNTVIFDILRTESAMDKKVLSFTLKPQRVALKLQLGDVKTILYRAYRAVMRLLPKKTPFHFYAELDFGKKALTTNSYTFKQPELWVKHVESMLEKVMQSDETVKIKDMEITFHFFMIPVGGKSNSTQSRDRESILNKTSVARIDNDDNNCFGTP